VTACEYSGRPPNTNSHQPSLRPEQHTARSEEQTRTKPGIPVTSDSPRENDLGRIIFQRAPPLGFAQLK